MDVIQKPDAHPMKMPAIVQEDSWTEIIEPRASLLNFRFQELWKYKDLVMMFVKRDIVSNYKQTILGPLWFFIQPLLTTLTFVLIFGNLAGISTDGIPMLAFYLAGITIWNYFAETLNKTATVFKDNAQMFGKVYFPRLTMPFSIVISNLVRFGIQFFLFLIVWAYYYFTSDSIHITSYLLFFPLLVLMMGLQALGLGMIISSMTTKYKDLIFLLVFGVQLLMYATPVIYPLSSLKGESFEWLIKANPMTFIVECFRLAFLGKGSFSWISFAYSSLVTIILLVIGTLIFNKVERGFTDTV